MLQALQPALCATSACTRPISAWMREYCSRSICAAFFLLVFVLVFVLRMFAERGTSTPRSPGATSTQAADGNSAFMLATDSTRVLR